MDALVAQQASVDKAISGLLRPLIDLDLAFVLYDMITIRTEGLSGQVGDVRHFGMTKEGLIARQVMLGVVYTADGSTPYHEIFDSNTGEVGMLKPIIEKIIQRYPFKRIIAVADRGLLSIDNLAYLQAMKLPGVSSVCWWRMSRKRPARPAPSVLHSLKSLKRSGSVDGHARWQDTGQRGRGRKLSYGVARARFYHEFWEAYLLRIVRVNLKSELFSYAIDSKALGHARLMDCKLLLVTNTAELMTAQVLNRYKSLAEVERVFR